MTWNKDSHGLFDYDPNNVIQISHETEHDVTIMRKLKDVRFIK